MWKEMLLGLALIGAGIGLLSPTPPTTKAPTAPRKFSYAKLFLRIKPSAIIEIEGESTDPGKRSYVVRDVITSRNKPITIRISRKHFTTQTLQWDGNENKKLTIRLVPDKSQPIVFFTLKSKPSGVVVKVDGQFFDETPTVIVTQRDAKVDIRLMKDDYKDHRMSWLGQRDREETIAMQPNEPDRMQLPLTWKWPLDRKVNPINLAKETLSKGTEINARDAQGNRMLHYAVLSQNRALAKWLLSKNADVNLSNRLGQTPFHLAALSATLSKSSRDMWQMRQMMELFKKQGAQIDAKDKNGQTPFLWSIRGLIEAKRKGLDRIPRTILSWLLQNGATIDAADLQDRTALHDAAANNKRALLEFLLKKKADPNLADKSGKTPLDHAAMNSHFQIATIIKRYGGKRGQ